MTPLLAPAHWLLSDLYEGLAVCDEARAFFQQMNPTGGLSRLLCENASEK